jgi:hypothetical protein
MTLGELAARQPRSRRLREDSGMSAFTGRKPASAPAAGQDPPADGTVSPPAAWQLPGSRTRKLLLGAFIGYFLLVPAVTGVVQHVTPTTVFITAGTVVFSGLVGWRVILRDRPGLDGVPWAWLVVLVALAIAVFAAGHGPGWLIILAVAAAACGRFTATIRPAAFGALSCGGASLIVTAQQARVVDAGTVALLVIVPPMAAYLTYASTKRNETVAELRQTRAEPPSSAPPGSSSRPRGSAARSRPPPASACRLTWTPSWPGRCGRASPTWSGTPAPPALASPSPPSPPRTASAAWSPRSPTTAPARWPDRLAPGWPG